MSSNRNPHFARTDRAAYELGDLLRKLPERLPSADRIDPEQRLIAEAARNHASNASAALLRGLEALGNVLSAAGSDVHGTVEQRTLMGLGELIAHLAVEAQFVRELNDNLNDALDPSEPGGAP